MANSKKPTLPDFAKVVRALGGNLTKVAEHYNINRSTIEYWRNHDPRFKQVIKNERCRMFDEALATSRIVALGVPKYEFVVDANGNQIYDAQGNPVQRMIGWAVAPDPNMLRYFMGVYGKYDQIGFADNDEGDVPQVINGINIENWIQLTNAGGKSEEDDSKPKRGRPRKK